MRPTKRVFDFPYMSNRIMIAAGQAAQTRDAHELMELLDHMAAGVVPLPTAEEIGSLRDYLAKKFHRKRGQSPAKEYAAEMTAAAVDLYRKLRATHTTESEDDTIERVRQEMGYHVSPPFLTIKNALHRSGAWRKKRRANNKVISGTK